MIEKAGMLAVGVGVVAVVWYFIRRLVSTVGRVEDMEERQDAILEELTKIRELLEKQQQR